MSTYRTTEFLSDGDVNHVYEDLNYQEKLKIKALEGLDSLAASLNAISNLKAIEFQINHLNDVTTGFNEQLTAKDAQIAALQAQIDTFDTTPLEAQIADLQAQNVDLQAKFNQFKAVLTSIDQMTDEVID